MNYKEAYVIPLGQQLCRRVHELLPENAIELNFEKNAPWIGIGNVWHWPSLTIEQCYQLISYMSGLCACYTGEPKLLITSADTTIESIHEKFSHWSYKSLEFFMKKN